MDFVRKIVSKQKVRFQYGNFNLDLTYITDRVIAMGFPSESVEGLYRNNMKDVQRFFNTLHPDHFKIYNLCSERKYDHERFGGSVSEYPFDDHNPPNLDIIGRFCKDVEEWLDSHPENIVGIHCKAGKGRTGTMIACWLMYNKHCQSSSESIRYFGNKRTHNGKGITIPSQARYVRYFEAILQYGKPTRLAPKVTKVLEGIKMNSLPDFDFLMGGTTIWLCIVQQDKCVFYSKPLKLKKGAKQVEIDCGNIILSNDVKIQFYNKNSKGYMFSYCFHTAFIDDSKISVRRVEIDKAHKDKAFPPNFSIELNFMEELLEEDLIDGTQGSGSPAQGNNNNNNNGNNTSPVLFGTSYLNKLDKLYNSTNQQNHISQDTMTSTATVATGTMDNRTRAMSSKEVFKCPRCNLPILPSEVSVNDGLNNYHWKCLTCHDCGKSLMTDNNCLFQGNGKTLCLDCGTSSGFFKFCSGCNLVIKTSNFEEFGELIFHKSCFLCCGCHSYLSGKDFIVKDNKQLQCSTCFEKLKKSGSIPDLKDPIIFENYITKDIPTDQPPVPESPPSATPSDSAPKNNDDFENGIICTKCNLSIGLRPIIIESGVFHKDCFTCTENDCGEPLDFNHYMWNEATNSPICPGCERKLIKSKKDQLYLLECQSREEEEKKQDDEDTSEEEEEEENDTDHQRKSIRKSMGVVICFGCQKKIEEDEMMDALGEKWHVQCLVCNTCNKPIEGTFGDHQGLIYCKEHYEDLVSLKCDKCKQIIDSVFVKFNGRHLHTHCFACTNCNKILQDGKYFERNGLILCELCRSVDIIKRRTQLQLQQNFIGLSRGSGGRSTNSSGSSLNLSNSSMNESNPNNNNNNNDNHLNSLNASAPPASQSFMSKVMKSNYRQSTRVNLSDFKRTESSKTLPRGGTFYPSLHRQMTSTSKFKTAYPSSKSNIQRKHFLSLNKSLTNTI